jgi:hypothetical protein
VIGSRRLDWCKVEVGSTRHRDYRMQVVPGSGGAPSTAIADGRSRYGDIVGQFNNKTDQYPPSVMGNLGTRPWHLAIIACTLQGSGNRQFLIGQADNIGGNDSFYINLTDANFWRFGIRTTGGAQNLTGTATGVTTRMQRIDLARLGSAFGFWVDGVSQGTLTDANPMFVSGANFVIGSLGERTDVYLGASGIVFSGLVERVVLVTDAVAAVPGRNFDPYERAIFERLV